MTVTAMMGLKSWEGFIKGGVRHAEHEERGKKKTTHIAGSEKHDVTLVQDTEEPLPGGHVVWEEEEEEEKEVETHCSFEKESQRERKHDRRGKETAPLTLSHPHMTTEEERESLACS